MTAIPNTVALSTIADDAAITASPHRSNYSAIQTAVNGLIAALSGGTAGQTFKAIDGSDVQWVTFPYCCASASGTTVADDTLTALQFDGETLDTDTMHDNVTNNTRLTCNTTGVYLILCQAWSGASFPGGTSQLSLYKNGSSISHTVAGATPGDGFVGAGRGFTFALISLASTDYIEAKIDVHGGGGVQVQGQIMALRVA